jgi:hypothetical protein
MGASQRFQLLSRRINPSGKSQPFTLVLLSLANPMQWWFFTRHRLQVGPTFIRARMSVTAGRIWSSASPIPTRERVLTQSLSLPVLPQSPHSPFQTLATTIPHTHLLPNPLSFSGTAAAAAPSTRLSNGAERAAKDGGGEGAPGNSGGERRAWR